MCNIKNTLHHETPCKCTVKFIQVYYAIALYVGGGHLSFVIGSCWSRIGWSLLKISCEIFSAFHYLEQLLAECIFILLIQKISISNFPCNLKPLQFCTSAQKEIYMADFKSLTQLLTDFFFSAFITDILLHFLICSLFCLL